MPTYSQQGAGPVSKHALNLHLGDRILFNVCSPLTEFALCEKGFALGALARAADVRKQQGQQWVCPPCWRGQDWLSPWAEYSSIFCRQGLLSPPGLGLSCQSKYKPGVTSTAGVGAVNSFPFHKKKKSIIILPPFEQGLCRSFPSHG